MWISLYLPYLKFVEFHECVVKCVFFIRLWSFHPFFVGIFSCFFLSSPSTLVMHRFTAWCCPTILWGYIHFLHSFSCCSSDWILYLSASNFTACFFLFTYSGDLPSRFFFFPFQLLNISIRLIFYIFLFIFNLCLIKRA